VDLEYVPDGPLHRVDRVKADDVFQALALKGRSVERDVDIRRAIFEVKLRDVTDPKSVLIEPRNIAEYGRGEGAAIIEQWLHLREFVLIGAAAGDERFESVLAFT
jgi:hypothetical protein